MTMNTRVIAESKLQDTRHVRLTKSVASDFYTVDGGDLGFLRTKDFEEAKKYYLDVVLIQLG